MIRIRLLVAVLVMLSGARFANATSITFTESVTANGSLGSSSFSNTLVTFTATGDTANVTLAAPMLFAISGLTISINIASLSTTAILTDTVYSYQGSRPGAGFVDGPVIGGPVILTTLNAAFSTYDLTTSIGPITGSSYLNSATFTTNLGSFAISSAGDPTFTATLGATPEPTTWSLFGLGLAGLVALNTRRKRFCAKAA